MGYKTFIKDMVTQNNGTVCETKVIFEAEVPIEELILNKSQELKTIKTLCKDLNCSENHTLWLVVANIKGKYQTTVPDRLTKYLKELTQLELDICEKELKNLMRSICDE